MLRKFIFFFLLITAHLSTLAVDRFAFGASPTDPFKSNSGYTRCPNFFDPTDQESLRPLIKGMPTDDQQSLDRVVVLLNERYEFIPEGKPFSDKIRSQNDITDYPEPQMILPIPSELVSLGMHLSPGRKVLVMDSKDGITPFLFAAAGATSVLMSHSDGGEEDLFNKRKESFPECAHKLDSVCCDPLTLLETRPDLKGTIDMFYCGHLLQVLPEEKLPALFSLLKDLLSPGGFVFFLTNSHENRVGWSSSSPNIGHYERDSRKYNIFGMPQLSTLIGSNDFAINALLYFDQKGHRVIEPQKYSVTYSAAITSPKGAKGKVPSFVM